MRQDFIHPEDHGNLQPYCGEEVGRLQHLGRSHVTHRFGDDDGGRTYRFNRLGFRGAEPHPSASHRVYVFGESHAFGYFVELEASWPCRFIDLWCEHEGLDRHKVELLNFADPGSSNASIARMVITQCSARRPDMVLVHFADIRRSEVILDGRPHRIGPWLLHSTAAETARAAPGNLPTTLLELIERGKGYFRHSLGPKTQWLAPTPDHTCLLENLRQILLVQSYCQAKGIRLVATCDRREDLNALALQKDPILAPLARALDENSLCDFGIWSMAEATGEAARDDDRVAVGHAGPSRHERFARTMFDFYLNCGGAPELNVPGSRRATTPQRDTVQDNTVQENTSPNGTPQDHDIVRKFYRELPFNQFYLVEAAALSIRKNPIRKNYPDLHRLLRQGHVRRVIDCGCGTGWLSNALALHYDVEVVGLDMTSKALERARALADHLGVDRRLTFTEQDLFEASFDDEFDLLVSLGVLHHTLDTRRAFDRVRTWAPQLYIGLYHQPGREPFLEYFHDLVIAQGEAAACEEFGRFGFDVDDVHRLSWFRDQVLHPRETSHSLREVVHWLDSAGLELVSTSINRFRKIRGLEPLFRAEAKCEAKSRRALRRRRFFPGFFTFLARRPVDWKERSLP